MTEKEAKNLSKGTIVIWDNDKDDFGTIGEVGYSGFYVVWANGQGGWIDFKDAEKVSVFQ